MRLALIVGHDSMRQGARMIAPFSLSEYKYNTSVALTATSFGPAYGIQVRVFDRNKGLEACYKQVNEWGHCAIELHFNANENAGIRGSEVLIDDNPVDNIQFAQFLQHQLCEVFMRGMVGNRGIKSLHEGDRGHRNLDLCKITGCLVEPFFGTNYEDAKTALERKERYAECLVLAAKGFLRTRL